MTDAPQAAPMREDVRLDRTPAQFFFEIGFAACLAQAYIANGKMPFEVSDALIERAWDIAGEAHHDPEEFDRYLALADAAHTARPDAGEVRSAYHALVQAGMHESTNTAIGLIPYPVAARPVCEALTLLPAGGTAVREALGKASEWAEKREELLDWTGSAWFAREENTDRRREMYAFLCELIGYLQAGEDAARAASAEAPS
jgi:hypothetical protein